MIEFTKTASYFSNVCIGDTFIHNDTPFIVTYEKKSERLAGINLTNGEMVFFSNNEIIIPTNFWLGEKQHGN